MLVPTSAFIRISRPVTADVIGVVVDRGVPMPAARTCSNDVDGAIIRFSPASGRARILLRHQGGLESYRPCAGLRHRMPICCGWNVHLTSKRRGSSPKPCTQFQERCCDNCSVVQLGEEATGRGRHVPERSAPWATSSSSSLAGFRLNYSMFELARQCRAEMALLRMQQDELAAERMATATKHQHEVGTSYFDEVMVVSRDLLHPPSPIPPKPPGSGTEGDHHGRDPHLPHFR